MSDQNQFDQYKQKLLHYWALFLAGCGTLWKNVKTYSRAAVEYIRRHAAVFGQMLRRYTHVLGQKLREFCEVAGIWLEKVWRKACAIARRAIQVLAGWMLLAREKSESVIEKAKALIASVRERFPKKEAALPAPEEPRALPAVEENVVEAAQTEQIPAVKAPENVPAWKSNPWLVRTMAVFGTIGICIKFIVKWICKLYKLILAAPVVWYAVQFARENMERLPEEVGLDIQSTGEFARMISRQEAVYWPLGITMFCLLLMFISKKPILPWIISIFTLVLPWLIWLLNYYA